MFIFTQPYISPLARSFIEANPTSDIINNDFLEAAAITGSEHFLEPDAATARIIANEGRWLYTNNENALLILDAILPQSHRLRECITLFKNKHTFRQKYQDIFPGLKFELLTLEELLSYSYSSFNRPFILKPAIGFLSAGVYRINCQQDLEQVQSGIIREMAETSRSFPKSIIDDSAFLIESIIAGREFAIDTFIADNNQPVIINIFEHVFKNEADMSDRLYISSSALIREWLEPFTEFIRKLASKADLRGFSMHVELRVDSSGNILPIEVNPLRFAGWCCTDLCYWAHGINPYEYFAAKKAPDWQRICEKTDDRIYCMTAISSSLVHSAKSFDYPKFAEEFTDLKELRRVDFNSYPLFGFAFFSIKNSEHDFLDWILTEDFKDYCIF